MNIIKVRPGKHPEVVKVDKMSLEWLQKQVGGYIQAVYPFDDPVAIVCDEEGKLKGKDLNRSLKDENGEIYDILSGDFLIVGLGDEDFCGLDDDMVCKYLYEFYPIVTYFRDPEGIHEIDLSSDEEKRNRELILGGQV